MTTLSHNSPRGIRTNPWTGGMRSQAVSQLLVILAAMVVPLYMSMFRFSVGSVLLRLSDVLAIVLILATYWIQPQAERCLRRPAVLMMFTLVLYILVEGLLMDRMTVSAKEAVQLGFVVVMTATVGWHAERDPQRFFRWFLVVALVCMLHTVAFHLLHGVYYRYKFAGDARYIFGVISTALLLAWRQDGWRGRWGWWFLVSLPPLAASLERKGALGVVLVALVFVALGTLRQMRVGAGVAILLVGLLGAAGATWELQNAEQAFEFAERNNYFVDEQEALWDSNTHRTALLLNGIDIIQQQPWFGSGADSLRLKMGKYFINPALSNSTHNFYLDNLIKYGFVGGGLFFIAIGTGLARVMRLSTAKLPAGLMSLYLLFAVFFISDGQAVTVMAMLPTFLGLMFNRAPPAQSDIPAALKASH